MPLHYFRRFRDYSWGYLVIFSGWNVRFVHSFLRIALPTRFSLWPSGFTSGHCFASPDDAKRASASGPLASSPKVWGRVFPKEPHHHLRVSCKTQGQCFVERTLINLQITFGWCHLHGGNPQQMLRSNWFECKSSEREHPSCHVSSRSCSS